MPTDIRIQGLDELRRRLNHDAMYKEALRIFASRAVRTGKRTAIEAIDGGTGLAAQSIVAKYEPGQGVIFLKSLIRSQDRIRSIEYGRRPGEQVSLGQLINWKHAVGHPLSAREIQILIKRQGVRPKGFLAKVEDRWKDSIPRWLDEAATRVEKRWNRK